MSCTIARTTTAVALSALAVTSATGGANAQETGSVSGLSPSVELSTPSAGLGSSSFGSGESGSDSGGWAPQGGSSASQSGEPGSKDSGSSSADSGIDGSLGEIDSDALLKTGAVVGSVALGSAGATALGIDVNAIVLQAITPLVDIFWTVVWSATASTITVPPGS